jgi:hypothetical protein
MHTLYPLPIGYSYLSDLIVVLDPASPVYLSSHIEAISGDTEGQRIDHYYIVLTQPDHMNRIHYCRLSVVRLVYHNGIAFAPDYAEQLEEVEVVRSHIEERLEGEGFTVRRGIVALPQSWNLIEGTFT